MSAFMSEALLLPGSGVSQCSSAWPPSSAGESGLSSMAEQCLRSANTEFDMSPGSNTVSLLLLIVGQSKPSLESVRGGIHSKS